MTFMEKIKHWILGLMIRRDYEKIRRLDEELARTTAKLYPRILKMTKEREELMRGQK